MEAVRTTLHKKTKNKLTKIAGLGFTCGQLCLEILNRLLVAGPRGTRLARGLLLQLGVLLLHMDEVKDDIETTGENEGQEEGEASQVYVALRTVMKGMSLSYAIRMKMD